MNYSVQFGAVANQPPDKLHAQSGLTDLLSKLVDSEEIEGSEESSEEDDGMILQGELFKYRPGISHSFIARWCVLTTETFSYYKSQYAYTAFPDRPLGQCPSRVIWSIDIDPQAHASSEYFMFEIVLKDENELLAYSREAEGFRSISPTKSKDPSGNNWWSIRELEWYSADKRFVFGTSTAQDRAKWLHKLRKLIRHNHPES